MFEAKTNNKSKYFKIALIVIVVLFVVFVIFRKISSENQTKPKIDINPKNEMIAVSENDQKRIKKLLEDNTNIKSDKIKDEMIVNKDEKKEQESKSEVIPVVIPTTNTTESINSEVNNTENLSENVEKNVVENPTNATENISNDTKEDSSSDTSQNKVKDAFENVSETKAKPVEEAVVQDTTTQPIQKTSDIKESNESLESSENIDMQFINDIPDLKLVKKDISILDNKFEYKGKVFNVGDKFGVFEIISIENKKIRFKKSEHYFYNLRFYQ